MGCESRPRLQHSREPEKPTRQKEANKTQFLTKQKERESATERDGWIREVRELISES